MRAFCLVARAAVCASVPVLALASCESRTSRSAPPPEATGTAHQPSIFATCNTTIQCNDPQACADQCEELWGENNDQGRTYSIFSECVSTSTTTNSDCYSECFMDCCENGYHTEDEPSCSCSRTPNGIHNYWCCSGVVPPTGTIQGWSDCPWCQYPNGDGTTNCSSGISDGGVSSSSSGSGSSSGGTDEAGVVTDEGGTASSSHAF